LLVLIWIVRAVVGHRFGTADIPFWTTPIFFATGMTMAFGGLVGLFEPRRFEDFFVPKSEPTSYSTQRHLFALIVGVGVLAQGVLVLIR
jgi:hypothetical protein